MFQNLGELLGFLPTTRRVAVAVGLDSTQRFAVVWNPRWRGYSFCTERFRPHPSQSLREERAEAVQVARNCFLKDFGPRFGATQSGHWMDQLEVIKTSGRDGRRVRYLYEVVLVTPRQPLPTGSFAEQFGTLSRQEILDSASHEPGPLARVVTWTTHFVLRSLIEIQHAALAWIERTHQGQREVLMTLNQHLRYFFPARRMRHTDESQRILAEEFTVGANLLGVRVEAEPLTSFELQQHHPLLGLRNYRFFVHRVIFTRPSPEQLFEALGGCGQAGWFAVHDHQNPLLSDTAQKVLQRLLAQGLV
ncbi:MAG: hypothetical protein SNJ82_13770 [Gemmataceae bacterium]